MDEYRVTKREVEAALYLANARVVRGTIFLAEFSATHSGKETVLDLLQSPDPMLPMLNLAGRFVLIGRSHVVAAVCNADVAGATDPGRTVPTEIHTTGGHVFAGDLTIASGLADRISDALNSHFDWHALADGDRITWVSRNHIIQAQTDA